MSTIKRFEDVLAWQKARELTRIVYRETSSGVFSRDYALRDQLRRASVSVIRMIQSLSRYLRLLSRSPDSKTPRLRDS
ncbi:MAG: four helix bundle protein [Planctomycetota bacterium]